MCIRDSPPAKTYEYPTLGRWGNARHRSTVNARPKAEASNARTAQGRHIAHVNRSWRDNEAAAHEPHRRNHGGQPCCQTGQRRRRRRQAARQRQRQLPQGLGAVVPITRAAMVRH
eukprot:9985755-Alexandrium_andersonii.AAC.1